MEKCSYESSSRTTMRVEDPHILVVGIGSNAPHPNHNNVRVTLI